MAGTFNDDNRNRNMRLQNWDYRWAGSYFITICTYNKGHFFGKIINEKMQLSHAGVIANLLWFEIKNHSKGVELGEFIVMPNHIHGILELTQFRKTDKESNGSHRYQNIGKNSVSSIILGYKSAVTKHCNRLQYDFGWQSKFYDHVIKHQSAYDNISNYIKNNPKNWKEDDFF